MKEYAEDILADVPIGSEFVLHFGGNEREVKNLIDLRVEIEHMSQDEFNHHVNSEKNDFANWIINVLKDKKLGEDVGKIRTPEEILNLLKSRINFAVSILEKENRSLIRDELKRLKKISDGTQSSFLKKQVNKIKEDISKISENLKLEKKVVDAEDDLEIIPWHRINEIPANARIVEFIFGFLIGMAVGLILGRAFLGL